MQLKYIKYANPYSSTSNIELHSPSSLSNRRTLIQPLVRPGHGTQHQVSVVAAPAKAVIVY